MIKNLKILFVDDDPDILDLYSIYLNREGFHNVVCCHDGDTCLKLLPYSNPDIIITDIKMPNINGRQLFSILKKNKMLDKTKIVVISGYNKDNIKWIKKADAFIEKNNGLPKILSLLNKYENELNITEKRFFKRYEKSHKALTINNDTNGLDSVSNISLSGIEFNSRFSFDIGAIIIINIKSWGKRNFIPIEGTIVRKDFVQDGFSYGLKFSKIIMPSLEKTG